MELLADMDYPEKVSMGDNVWLLQSMKFFKSNDDTTSEVQGILFYQGNHVALHVWDVGIDANDV